VIGIILVAEMTGSFTLLLPMLLACTLAIVVPTMLRNAQVYDSSGKRLSRGQRPAWG